MIGEEMKKRLMAFGLSKQQVESPTADKIVNGLMSADDKILIQEAKNQLEELMQKINTASETFVNIANVQKEFGKMIKLKLLLRFMQH